MKKIKEYLLKGLQKKDICTLTGLSPYQVDKAVNKILVSMSGGSRLTEDGEEEIDEMDIETYCPTFTFEDLSFTEKLIYMNHERGTENAVR